jgi:hypothetical protein
MQARGNKRQRTAWDASCSAWMMGMTVLSSQCGDFITPCQTPRKGQNVTDANTSVHHSCRPGASIWFRSPGTRWLYQTPVPCPTAAGQEYLKSVGEVGLATAGPGLRPGGRDAK